MKSLIYILQPFIVKRIEPWIFKVFIVKGTDIEKFGIF